MKTISSIKQWISSMRRAERLAGSPGCSTEATLESWCDLELAGWRLKRPSYEASLVEYRHLNETQPGVFLYSLKGSEVEIMDKPESIRYDSLCSRSNVYLHLFSAAMQMSPLKREIIIAVEVGDGSMTGAAAPTFAFQKNLGDPAILINDVNFMEGNFYEEPLFTDNIKYFEKDDKAIFVGSTSGMHNSYDGVLARDNPRIDAAVFFKDVPSVDFWLPSIVQSDPAAEALIREMDIGGAGFMPFGDQFRYKSLISMDGNGATCQRIAVALKSNSTLLKYNSVSILYYFAGLIPWIHYLPISRHQEVVDFVEMQYCYSYEIENVAKKGQEFFQKYLTKEPSIRYAASLINQYADVFRF